MGQCVVILRNEKKNGGAAYPTEANEPTDSSLVRVFNEISDLMNEIVVNWGGRLEEISTMRPDESTK